MKSSLKPFRATLSCLLAMVLLNACNSQADFTYVDGKPGSFSDFNGRWLVVNYWAEWCKPCLQEIPELNRFAASHPDIRLVGINYDSLPATQEQEAVKKAGINYPATQAPLHEHYGYDMPRSLPTTVIINPEGKVTRTLLGPQTVESLLANLRP